jgi:hypothetical protein
MPLPSSAREDEDGGSPCPEDGDFFDARPNAAALEGGFLPKMNEEQQKRFTPSELLLYKHAVEYR